MAGFSDGSRLLHPQFLPTLLRRLLILPFLLAMTAWTVMADSTIRTYSGTVGGKAAEFTLLWSESEGEPPHVEGNFHFADKTATPDATWRMFGNNAREGVLEFETNPLNGEWEEDPAKKETMTLRKSIQNGRVAWDGQWKTRKGGSVAVSMTRNADAGRPARLAPKTGLPKNQSAVNSETVWGRPWLMSINTSGIGPDDFEDRRFKDPWNARFPSKITSASWENGQWNIGFHLEDGEESLPSCRDTVLRVEYPNRTELFVVGDWCLLYINAGGEIVQCQLGEFADTHWRSTPQGIEFLGQLESCAGKPVKAIRRFIPDKFIRAEYSDPEALGIDGITKGAVYTDSVIFTRCAGLVFDPGGAGPGELDIEAAKVMKSKVNSAAKRETGWISVWKREGEKREPIPFSVFRYMMPPG